MIEVKSLKLETVNVFHLIIKMMKIASIIFSLLLFACVADNEAPPLTKSQFKSVYNEITILEGYYQMNFRNLSIYKDSLLKSVDSVLKKHDVSFEEFEQTYNYYSRHQEAFQALNNELIQDYSK